MKFLGVSQPESKRVSLFMGIERIDLIIGLIGDDHVLSLFNIQRDEDLRAKFEAIAPLQWDELMRFRIKNYGVVGDCTEDLEYRLRHELDLSSIDYSIFCIGSNDVLLGKEIQEIVENLERILLYAAEQGTTPVFCTLLPISKPKYKEIVTDINSILTIFCAKEDIQVIDLNSVFNDGRDQLDPYFDLGDGIHLSQEGYLMMADNLLLRMFEVIMKELQDYQSQQHLGSNPGGDNLA